MSLNGLCEVMPTTALQRVVTVCTIFETLLTSEGPSGATTALRQAPSQAERLEWLDRMLLFGIIWGIGGPLDDMSKTRFSVNLLELCNNTFLRRSLGNQSTSSDPSPRLSRGQRASTSMWSIGPGVSSVIVRMKSEKHCERYI